MALRDVAGGLRNLFARRMHRSARVLDFAQEGCLELVYREALPPRPLARTLASAGIAASFGRAAARLAATEWEATRDATHSLVGRLAIVVADEQADGALVDAAWRADTRVLLYRHHDLDHLVRVLARARRLEPGRKRLVLTERTFRADGSRTALAPLVAVAHAHASDVLLNVSADAWCSRAEPPDPRIAIVGGLSTAFGIAGGYWIDAADRGNGGPSPVDNAPSGTGAWTIATRACEQILQSLDRVAPPLLARLDARRAQMVMALQAQRLRVTASGGAAIHASFDVPQAIPSRQLEQALRAAGVKLAGTCIRGRTVMLRILMRLDHDDATCQEGARRIAAVLRG